MHQGINTVADKLMFQETGFPIIQSKNITKGFLDLTDVKCLDETDYLKYQNKYRPNIDDVLVCNIGTIGKSLKIEKVNEFLIAWNLFLIKIKKDKLHPQYFIFYLEYLLQTKYFDKFLTGGTIKFINKKTMGNIPIPLPPLPEQKRIADLLDAADRLRQKDKALLEKYDQLAQSLFLEMFGDPVKNEKGWEVKKITNLTESVKNIDNSYKNNFIEYIDISSINNKDFSITSSTKFQLKDKPSRAQQILMKDDILLSTVRPNLKNIAIVNEDGYIGSTGFFVVRVKNDLSRNFVFRLLTSDSITDYFSSITAGANYPALKNADIKKLEIIVPPIDLQNQFAEQVQLIEQQKELAKKNLKKSEELFGALMGEVFGG
jgi:type I restriction enzyme S subunit